MFLAEKKSECRLCCCRRCACREASGVSCLVCTNCLFGIAIRVCPRRSSKKKVRKVGLDCYCVFMEVRKIVKGRCWFVDGRKRCRCCGVGVGVACQEAMGLSCRGQATCREAVSVVVAVCLLLGSSRSSVVGRSIR